MSDYGLAGEVNVDRTTGHVWRSELRTKLRYEN